MRNPGKWYKCLFGFCIQVGQKWRVLFVFFLVHLCRRRFRGFGTVREGGGVLQFSVLRFEFRTLLRSSFAVLVNKRTNERTNELCGSCRGRRRRRAPYISCTPHCTSHVVTHTHCELCVCTCIVHCRTACSSDDDGQPRHADFSDSLLTQHWSSKMN